MEWESEWVYNISPNFTIVITMTNCDIYISLKINQHIAILNKEQWKKFKRILTIINTECNL